MSFPLCTDCYSVSDRVQISSDLFSIIGNAVPKGGIEKGETSGQAAVRESYEEGPCFLPLHIETCQLY